jgi:predicted aspartyl protease
VTFPFNPARGLIRVRVNLAGPLGNTFVDLALDTGATSTLIGMDPLQLVGYDPASTGQPISVTTAAGVVPSFRLPILSLTALGQTRTTMSILARALPPTSSVDGLLGLDFLRGHILTIDLIKGEITLTPGGATP